MNRDELAKLYKKLIKEYFTIYPETTKKYSMIVNEKMQIYYNQKLGKNQPLTKGQEALNAENWFFISKVWDYMSMFTVEFDISLLQETFNDAFFEEYGYKIF